jgi:hypothetical protein
MRLKSLPFRFGLAQRDGWIDEVGTNLEAGRSSKQQLENR